MKKNSSLSRQRRKEHLKNLIGLTISCAILNVEEKKTILERLSHDVNDQELAKLKKLLPEVNEYTMVKKARILWKGNSQ